VAAGAKQPQSFFFNGFSVAHGVHLVST